MRLADISSPKGDNIMQLAQGVCEKHQMARVDRGGETICLVCESETTPKTGITVQVADPGEEELRKMLAKSGVAVPPNSGKAPMPDVPMPVRTHRKPVVVAQTVPEPTVDDVTAKKIAEITLVSPKDAFAGKVELALGIMKSLPMPSDVKQFKAIQKVIAGMESLLGEK